MSSTIKRLVGAGWNTLTSYGGAKCLERPVENVWKGRWGKKSVERAVKIVDVRAPSV